MVISAAVTTSFFLQEIQIMRLANIVNGIVFILRIIEIGFGIEL